MGWTAGVYDGCRVLDVESEVDAGVLGVALGVSCWRVEGDRHRCTIEDLGLGL